MSKKGVSPVIAFVLMMSFAVALGAIVINWYLSASKEQSEILLGSAESSAECGQVNMNIGLLNATYPNPAEQCSIKILNTGDLKIKKLKFEYFPSGNIYDPVEVNINPRSSIVIELPVGEESFEKMYVTPIIVSEGTETACPKDTTYSQEPGWYSGC